MRPRRQRRRHGRLTLQDNHRGMYAVMMSSRGRAVQLSEWTADYTAAENAFFRHASRMN